MTWNTALQIGIILSSCSAVWLLARKDKWRRWGYITGIVGQPLWFISAMNVEPKLWAVMGMTLFYAYSYWKGIDNYWVHPEAPNANS